MQPLHLPGDQAPQGARLHDHLAASAAAQTGPASVILAIASALPAIAARLAAGRLYGDPARRVGVNDSGDSQKAMDVAAHHYVLEALKGAGVARVLSEEADEVTLLDPNGRWDLAMDPIDGSGSIGIGAPLGLFFAIFPAGRADFLRSGREVVAAGYASFGHALDYGFSLGAGVDLFAYDPAQAAFFLVRQGVQLKPQASTIAYNASNERHWPPALQAWAQDLRAGKEGPRGRDFNMRWLAAAAGELHRILLEGGAFLYPADRRKGYERGRLRTLYEAFPVAFLIEQAGGSATDGARPILDRLPEAAHEHTPLIFGASEEVALITRCLTGEIQAEV